MFFFYWRNSQDKDEATVGNCTWRLCGFRTMLGEAKTADRNKHNRLGKDGTSHSVWGGCLGKSCQWHPGPSFGGFNSLSPVPEPESILNRCLAAPFHPLLQQRRYRGELGGAYMLVFFFFLKSHCNPKRYAFSLCDIQIILLSFRIGLIWEKNYGSIFYFLFKL